MDTTIGTNSNITNSITGVSFDLIDTSLTSSSSGITVINDKASHDELMLEIAAIKQKNKYLKTELENERMKVIACGIAATSLTDFSIAQSRITKDSPYWSEQYQNICNLVDDFNTHIKKNIK